VELQAGSCGSLNLVVDTSVWSLVLRRPQVDETNPYVRAFRAHIGAEDGVFLTGNVLQELLDGLRSKQDFERLQHILEPFPLVPIHRTTYVAAAELRQRCRTNGIQAGPIDCLIAAACIEQGFPLLSADQDFTYIAKYSDLVLLEGMNGKINHLRP
jgi:predicted nucleic acid-binding protein